MQILGIETSCDETAAAVVTDRQEILANIVHSQIEHEAYGGVVPEIASRVHIDKIEKVIKQAMDKASIDFCDLDAIAVTAGPGLIGGVIVGLMTAKGIALAAEKPLIAVNHLEGHALTVRLTDNIPFPFLLLLVSGGHCQILMVEGVGKYTRMGTTLDDALGEAFDKVAKMLGLGYPGGSVVEHRASKGNPDRFNFPRPLLGRQGCDFSFSGLKTAVFREVTKLELSETNINDVCASFQKACGDVLVDRMKNAIKMAEDGAVANSPPLEGGARGGVQKNLFSTPPPNLPHTSVPLKGGGIKSISQQSQDRSQIQEKSYLLMTKNCQLKASKTHTASSEEGKRIVIAGGVAANKYLNKRLSILADEHNYTITSPPIKLCTDNAAMIAWVGVERLKLGMIDSFDVKPRARWQLCINKENSHETH